MVSTKIPGTSNETKEQAKLDGKREKGLLSPRSLRKHRLQRVLARHLLPGGAPVVQLDEAAAVGVDAVLVEPPRHLGRPHRLHQVPSHGGELVVDEEVGARGGRRTRPPVGP